MAYRTKVYDFLNKKYLKPILKFVGLTIDKSNEISMLAWVGDNVDEEYDRHSHKVSKKGHPNWFINDKKDPFRIYTFIESQDEYLKYRKNSDKLEYFNPFAKWANAQMLLMLMIPNLYERYCLTDECNEDDYDDYIDELLFDRVMVTQEELLKHVNIKYFPVEMDEETGESIYHYEINITRDNGEEVTLVSRSKNRSVCLLILMTKILALVDEIIDIEEIDNMKPELEEMIEKYMRERELNYRDLKKVSIEKDIDFMNPEIEENQAEAFANNVEMQSVEDIVNAGFDTSDENELSGIELEKDNSAPIDITERYKDSINIGYKDEDDEIDMFDGIVFDLI